MKIKKILLNNIGLKLLALLLAFLTWIYIGEATKEGPDETVIRRFFTHTPYIIKKLNVRPIFVGAIPEGHEIIESQTTVTPESLTVIGPPKVLAKKEFIYTKPIDLSEHTKTKAIEVGVEDLSPSISLQKIKVQVYLVVEKKKAEKMTE